MDKITKSERDQLVSAIHQKFDLERNAVLAQHPSALTDVKHEAHAAAIKDLGVATEIKARDRIKQQQEACARELEDLEKRIEAKIRSSLTGKNRSRYRSSSIDDVIADRAETIEPSIMQKNVAGQKLLKIQQRKLDTVGKVFAIVNRKEASALLKNL